MRPRVFMRRRPPWSRARVKLWVFQAPGERREFWSWQDAATYGQLLMALIGSGE
jgi:hypothetical protein